MSVLLTSTYIALTPGNAERIRPVRHGRSLPSAIATIAGLWAGLGCIAYMLG